MAGSLVAQAGKRVPGDGCLSCGGRPKEVRGHGSRPKNTERFTKSGSKHKMGLGATY